MRADDSNIVFYIGLLLFMIAPLQFCWCINSTSANITQEREALLKLKHSFFDLYGDRPVLKSWEGNDYCKWEGVGCDPITLHVLNLDLRQNQCGCQYDESSTFEKCNPCLFAHEVNRSILELKQLNYLDFSGINFGGDPIPEFLSSMKQLRYLNLSSCGFGGKFPHHFGNLSNLQVLDLSYNFYEFLDNNIGWLSKLSSLKHLAMNGVSLRNAYNLLHVLDTLPFLFQVELSACRLINTHIFPRGPVNSTFLNKVQALNLARNDLHGPFPNAFRNLTSIRDLNLRGNYLTSVPYWLNNFHSLVHLDLSYNPFKKIEASVLSILTNMCSLRSLDLSKTIAVIGRLGPNHGNYSRCRRYNLEVLMLRGNGIKDSFPFWIGDLSNLKILDLRMNSFDGPIPLSLGNLLALRTLNLSGNLLNGPIPSSFGNLLALRTLDLSGNLLNGSIPSSFGNFLALRTLDLPGNLLNGPIPSSFGNLLALRSLDLSGNLLNGTIPTSIGSLSELTALHLSHNQLQGSIPTTIGQLSSLRELDLSNNHLNGSIPESLGQLGKLTSLRVVHNSLSGIVSETHLMNLSNLIELQIGFNNLTVKIESNWTPPFKYLEVLVMASCNIGPHFPLWLQTQQFLDFLDISNNQIRSIPKDIDRILPYVSSLNLQGNLIQGSMPDSLRKMEWLFVLDLSNNKLSGKIPNCWGGKVFSIFNVASNQLSGTIPSSFGNLTVAWLNLSNNSLHGEPFLVLKNTRSLQILDLGVNQLSGKIPSSWIMITSIQNLRLRQNLFSGDIPASLCQLPSLQILDLAYNNFSGSIPPCIGHLKGMMKNADTTPIMEVGAPSNAPTADPAQVEGVSEWEKQELKEVLKGYEQDYTKNLKYLVNIDLSNNNLIGSIPEGLTFLSGLIGLSLSHNHLSGQIPSNIQQMESIESIDFSNNNLSGPIPINVSIMDNLGFLNLSNNNFSGPIPWQDHLLAFDEPYFAGNPYLCGEPLKNKCFDGDDVPTTTSMGHEDNNTNSDKKEKVLFYFVVALGFITGFWAFFGTLLLKKNWKHAYFSYVDKVADSLYVTIMVRLRK